VSVDPATGVATPRSAHSSLLAVGLGVSPDGTTFYVSMRDQFVKSCPISKTFGPHEYHRRELAGDLKRQEICAYTIFFLTDNLPDSDTHHKSAKSGTNEVRETYRLMSTS
jgi:hypothetical protein